MKKYTVKSGDTLGTIAKQFYGSASKYLTIAEANGIDNPNIIRVGQELELPGIEEETVDAPPADENNSEENTTVTLENNDQPTVAAASVAGFFSVETLKEIMPQATDENIEKYLNALNDEMGKFEINTPLRAAHFIAQLAHESASFKYVSENLNYSAKALRAVFGKYFPTDELADEYARQPEKIANKVYANRMSNGDEASGDGWKYRGRGLIQLTGKDNYSKLSEALGIDLVAYPDQLATSANLAVGAAGWFWDMRNLNTYADQDDIKAITKRINGGYNGLEDREKYFDRAREVLNA